MSSPSSQLHRRRLLAGILPAAAYCAGSQVAAAQSHDAPGSPPAVVTVSGDGSQDQTTQLQQAVEQTGGGVFLQGTIRISKPVVLELDRLGTRSIFGDGSARVIMSGAGPAFRLVGTHDGTAAPHTVKPNVWERQRMPCLDGFSIDGEHEQACGIEAVKTMGMVLTRLHVRHCHHAVHLRERNRNFIIQACHFYDNRGIGVYYDHVDLHQSNIGDSHISYNAGGGVVSRGGNVRNIHIGNCDLEGNHPPKDSPASAATANILIDCRQSKYGTAEVAITGCTIQHTRNSPDSANVRILGRSDSHREGHVTITGNVFSDVQTNVHLSSVRGATITGNTFWQGFTHNLLIEDSAEIAIGSNNLNRNPRYSHSRFGHISHEVLIRDSRDVTICGLVLNGVRQTEGGLRLEKCRRIVVNGCTLGDCDGPPLRLQQCDGVVVQGCVIGDQQREDAVAVRADQCGRIELAGNIVYGKVVRPT